MNSRNPKGLLENRSSEPPLVELSELVGFRCLDRAEKGVYEVR
jgi:hypothetical protein